MSYDIIGDIHGCYDELTALLTKLGYQRNSGIFIHPQGRKLAFVGDATDRGPQSLAVLNLLFAMQDAKQLFYSPGNHCNKLYRFFKGHQVHITHGLETTVNEFNLLHPKDKREQFRKRYIKFYEALPFYQQLDNGQLIIAHAGIREDMIGRPLQKNIIVFVLYGDISGQSLSDGRPLRKDWAKQYKGSSLVVYGHTPTKEARFKNHTVNIDTGCVFGGKLTALRYPQLEIVSVPSFQPYVKEKFHEFDD
ncbi:bis(5'-nucleosyl)-tetraphosphatase PrpE [Paenisporosarcina sp. TG-14]|uniref:bis(5'-nucleosyl)-tetraphosphatase PrpE n=1 Tax=Paenisporosarcina sp. TG-14 TaxID=1231057 RepID=UPI0002EA0BA1|nr:bis(5'-nucleosyl)-tetraphosphatase PrpE [Paenisporosarcina sp. TG-14]